MSITGFYDPPLPASASLGLLAARFGLSVVFMYHGAQKLFSWFGGHGLGGLTERFGPVLANLTGIGEFFGGVCVLLGLFSRFSAASIIAIMIGAIVTVHGKNGFGGDGGFEYNFTLICLALPILLSGPGAFALARFLPAKLKPWAE